jgi:hypothetical protein
MTANEPKCECGADDYNDRLLKRTGPGEGMRFVPHALNCPTAPKESKPESVDPDIERAAERVVREAFKYAEDKQEREEIAGLRGFRKPAPPTPEPALVVLGTPLTFSDSHVQGDPILLIAPIKPTSEPKPCLPECREICDCPVGAFAQPRCVRTKMFHATGCPNAPKPPEPKERYRFELPFDPRWTCLLCGCLVGDRVIHDVACGKGWKV